MADSSYYYCSKDNSCTDTFVENYSCEQGLSTCLAYKATDLGVLEIPPFNKTHLTINQTITDGNSMKFAISNQDSKTKGWFEVQLYSKDSSTMYTSAPSQFCMYYYDQTSGNMTTYVFSGTGKSYLKPLNTRFFYVVANGGDFTLYVTYGNTKWARHQILLGATTLLMLISYVFVF